MSRTSVVEVQRLVVANDGCGRRDIGILDHRAASGAAVEEVYGRQLSKDELLGVGPPDMNIHLLVGRKHHVRVLGIDSRTHHRPGVRIVSEHLHNTYDSNRQLLRGPS